MDQEWITEDLALATVLRIRGNEPRRLELREGVAYWVFTECGRINRVIDQYNAGNCLVEPRRYNIKLRETRRMLFKFLNSNGITPQPSARV